MSLSMSEANRRIKSGLGSTPLDPVPSYTRLVRYTPESVLQAALSRAGSRAGRFLPLVRACLHWTLADRAAAGLLNLGRDLADRSLLAGAAQDIHISPVDRFGAEIDALWEKVSPCFHAAVVRNAAYLNWKYVRQPHVGYQRFIAWRGDEACGYVILRVGKPPERRLGILADLLADPQDTSAIRTLLVYAVRYFKDARVKDISAASTVREFQSGYLALGFRKDKELYPMMHCKYEGAEFEKAKEPGAWCLGRGDHDWDQYPLGR
jgi:hypothetical protein